MFENLIRLVAGESRTTHCGHDAFNHCSTICKYQKGVLLAWYSAKAECTEDQSVYVSYVNEYGEKSKPISIGDGVGNPVLINTSICDAPVLLWSKFEDLSITKRSDRWGYCSLWVQRILVKNDQPLMVGNKKQLTDPSQHLLGRCSPITYGSKILLPLYDEVDGRCVIFNGNDIEYGEISRYGDDIIQPTLWVDGDKIFSMSRNFRRKIKNTKSQLYYSTDPCVADSWLGPADTGLWNMNNSVQVARLGDDDLVLWNDTSSQNRSNLTLGILISGAILDTKKIDIISDTHGSYPSMCVDDSNNLHMTFTNSARQIEHVVWTGRKFRNARRNSRYRRRRSECRRYFSS